MNIDQLMESLSDNAPEPHHVLAAVGRKRRAARNRMYTAGGGLAVAIVAVTAGVLLRAVVTGAVNSADSGSAQGIAAPAAGGPAQFGPASASPYANSHAAPSCDTAGFQAELASAVRAGASIIVGYGTLTGRADTEQGAHGGAAAYYSLTLRSVRTLAGPAVPPGSTAWLAGASQAAGASATSGVSQQQAIAPRDELFGIVSPRGGSGAPGPVLQAALVTDGQVVLADPGCWDVTASAAPVKLPNAGRTAIPEAAGSAAATSEIPLAVAEKLATQAR